MQSPFAVQDLVDYLMDFLCHSKADLKTCALVCRSWLYPAQSHLFRRISIILHSELGDMDVWPRLLYASPHLHRHIRQLELCFRTAQGSAARVSEVCDFPFTHLEWVWCTYVGDLSAQNAVALRQLFGLPTLRHVKCKLPASPDHHHIPKPIVLASLSVQNFTTLTLNRRLLLLMQPFTVSNLKALSIMAGSVEWPDVAPAMDTLEILEIHSESDHTNFDLNAFPKIHLLRIRVAPAATTNFIAADRYMGLLFSIARALHLRTVIQLHCGEPQLSAICATFDQALATLRGLAVEIVFSLTQKAPLAALFPKLSAKKCFVVHRSIGIGGT
ncbi:hypothetical protein DFH06DRAFT_1396626 [Mycena polygramma]|nr:hypothetical protein DFH06DRAFT_1396626 [Mycena polygramma]